MQKQRQWGLSLLWAKDVGLPLHVIEFDALGVIKSANNHSHLHIISVLSFYPRVSVAHVHGEANKAAHEFAKLAFKIGSTSFGWRNQ
ncbi:hypothetical protein TorRG33x02_228350 [Trema orientale]|uniref:RNase H type-1 domain-containing protein n=1 Tax=Trema orientale TaxID=63057 RepID=A0A2P5E6X6_TREOI|nr:hypothetical protein TorRG33x02_228350 [Trema orientale]